MSAAISDILGRAADLIEPEGAHCLRWCATDVSGVPADFDSADATRWSVLGAVLKVAHASLPLRAASEAVDEIAALFPGASLAALNRAGTKAEVVSKLREAAALAREQSK